MAGVHVCPDGSFSVEPTVQHMPCRSTMLLQLQLQAAAVVFQTVNTVHTQRHRCVVCMSSCPVRAVLLAMSVRRTTVQEEAPGTPPRKRRRPCRPWSLCCRSSLASHAKPAWPYESASRGEFGSNTVAPGSRPNAATRTRWRKTTPREEERERGENPFLSRP